MPVKRRVDKRRIDPIAEVVAWTDVFETEFDFFGDLRAFGGVDLDAYGRTSREAAEAAWARLGALYLSTRSPDPHRRPWAAEQFGHPEAD